MLYSGSEEGAFFAGRPRSDAGCEGGMGLSPSNLGTVNCVEVAEPFCGNWCFDQASSTFRVWRRVVSRPIFRSNIAALERLRCSRVCFWREPLLWLQACR